MVYDNGKNNKTNIYMLYVCFIILNIVICQSHHWTPHPESPWICSAGSGHRTSAQRLKVSCANTSKSSLMSERRFNSMWTTTMFLCLNLHRSHMLGWVEPNTHFIPVWIMILVLRPWVNSFSLYYYYKLLCYNMHDCISWLYSQTDMWGALIKNAMMPRKMELSPKSPLRTRSTVSSRIFLNGWTWNSFDFSHVSDHPVTSSVFVGPTTCSSPQG